jgi:hypothetical protein
MFARVGKKPAAEAAGYLLPMTAAKEEIALLRARLRRFVLAAGLGALFRSRFREALALARVLASASMVRTCTGALTLACIGAVAMTLGSGAFSGSRAHGGESKHGSSRDGDG